MCVYIYRCVSWPVWRPANYTSVGPGLRSKHSGCSRSTHTSGASQEWNTRPARRSRYIIYVRNGIFVKGQFAPIHDLWLINHDAILVFYRLTLNIVNTSYFIFYMQCYEPMFTAESIYLRQVYINSATAFWLYLFIFILSCEYFIESWDLSSHFSGNELNIILSFAPFRYTNKWIFILTFPNRQYYLIKKADVYYWQWYRKILLKKFQVGLRSIF